MSEIEKNMINMTSHARCVAGRRLARLRRHLTDGTGENETYGTLEEPPIAQMKEGRIFPTFPDMMEDAEKYGGVFTYALWGGRRLTVLADPSTYEIVFHPGEYGTYPLIVPSVCEQIQSMRDVIRTQVKPRELEMR